MKLKSLLFALCFCLVGHAFAGKIHLNPNASEADKTKKTATKATIYPGYCQIEIINDSFDDLSVNGTFDDGSGIGFGIPRYDAPHYIDLYYYGYCHSNMYLTVRSAYSGYLIYAGYTNVNSTIRVVPYLTKGATAKQSLKAEVTSK